MEFDRSVLESDAQFYRAVGLDLSWRNQARRDKIFLRSMTQVDARHTLRGGSTLCLREKHSDSPEKQHAVNVHSRASPACWSLPFRQARGRAMARKPSAATLIVSGRPKPGSHPPLRRRLLGFDLYVRLFPAGNHPMQVPDPVLLVSLVSGTDEPESTLMVKLQSGW